MQALKKNYQRIFSLKQAKRVVLALIFILFFDFFLFPAPALAGQITDQADLSLNQEVLSELEETILEQDAVDLPNINFLPENDELTVKSVRKYIVTAYNSEVGQCDDSPCVTANGFNVCEYGIEDTVAANFLPFGAKIRFPELFGDRVFVVRDRMNSRYTHRIDIWMNSKISAKQFGVKLAKIEILE